MTRPFRLSTSIALGLLCGGVLAPGISRAQEPPLVVCNQSTYAVNAAIAVARRAQTSSRGWFALKPGDCAQALDQAPRRAEIFLFAETAPAYSEGRRLWSGRAELCVAPTDRIAPDNGFDIEDARTCEDPNVETRPFAEVTARPGAGGPRTVILAEPADYAIDRARIAGAQRLLFELGHLSDAPDGLLGGATREAIAAFLGEAAGAWNGDIDEALLDDLLDAAIARAGRGGLSICNDARKDIWAATGEGVSAEKADRSAKGWWRVSPGECRQVAAGPLDAGVSYAVFAEMRDGEDRLVAGGDGEDPIARFCIDVVKFETGAENCAARGLIERSFRRLPAPVDGRLVARFGERDFQAVDDGALDG